MLFHPMNGTVIRSDSASAVKEAFSQRYNVDYVREGFLSGVFGSIYHVYLNDGHHLTVYVEKKNNWLGEETYIKHVDE